MAQIMMFIFKYVEIKVKHPFYIVGHQNQHGGMFQ